MISINFDSVPDHHLINTERRREFQNKSFFYRHIHAVEKMVVDYELYTQILSYFDQSFKINDLEHTARIWNFVLKSRNISWEREDDLTGEKFKQIYHAFQDALVYTGAGVDFPIYVDGDVPEVAEFLFAKEETLPLSFFSWENIKNILFSTEESYLTEFREKLEEALRLGFDTFTSGKTSEEAFKGFLFNVLALYPFAYPTEGMTLQIPVKVNGEWKMANYRVDKKFELSPSWFSSPLPIYGLVSEEGPPILTCLGTTYPAGEGFIATVLSDCTPGFSPGHAAALYGKQEIGEWLKDKKNVIATGASLGGAISLHLSRHHKEAISEVRVFNSPGHYPWTWWGEDHSHTEYHIYSNDNDLVSTMGIFPEGKNVNVYRVLPPQSEDFVSSHSKVYAAADRVTIIRTSAGYENKRLDRILLTIGHMTFGFLVFVTLLPFHLIYRLCYIIYRLISRLCYNPSKNPEKIDDAKLFGSSTERDQPSFETSPIKS